MSKQKLPQERNWYVLILIQDTKNQFPKILSKELSL